MQYQLQCSQICLGVASLFLSDQDDDFGWTTQEEAVGTRLEDYEPANLEQVLSENARSDYNM